MTTTTSTINEFDYVSFAPRQCFECLDERTETPYADDPQTCTVGLVAAVLDDGLVAEVHLACGVDDVCRNSGLPAKYVSNVARLLVGEGRINFRADHYAIIPLAELTVIP